MRGPVLGFMLLGAMATPAFADSLVDCAVEFEILKKKYPFDLEQCVAKEAVIKLADCPKPDSFVGRAPTTHVILALDASGSMAGKVDGKTKMAIAKREALVFVNDLHPTTKVSLVVYGHEGDNTETGKSLSCKSSAVLHGFRTPRHQMKTSIGALQPTGWTPLAGVLKFIRSEVEALPTKTGGKQTAPVVYLISDGEETCGGDPVVEAKALVDLGTRTIVNTIGFDADAETRAQLEAISDAGEGKFYPADNAKSLQKLLNEIVEAEGKIHWFNYCVNLNTAKISGTYQKVGTDMMRCYSANDPTKFEKNVRNEIKSAAQDSAIGKCASELSRATREYVQPYGFWLMNNVGPINEMAVKKSRAYEKEMGLIDIKR